MCIVLQEIILAGELVPSSPDGCGSSAPQMDDALRQAGIVSHDDVAGIGVALCARTDSVLQQQIQAFSH